MLSPRTKEEGGARQGYDGRLRVLRDPVPRGTRNVEFRLGLEPIPPIKTPQSDRLTAEMMGVKEGKEEKEGVVEKKEGG